MPNKTLFSGLCKRFHNFFPAFISFYLHSEKFPCLLQFKRLRLVLVSLLCAFAKYAGFFWRCGQRSLSKQKTISLPLLPDFGGSPTEIAAHDPNYEVTPFARSHNPTQITHQLDIYNEIAENINAEYGLSFGNITLFSNGQKMIFHFLHPISSTLLPNVYSAVRVEEILPAVTEIIK